ncbi:MAG: Holliday junction DNA helicase RuvA [Legionellales bacterium RIFCSPHIGHO2_12_FULL_37_14]|nr:MAG: Holliday junction DNA helicase RuvA [Legionellales bacterium RIFCSPHIGHO2_12_FULL_37_14]
MGFDFGLRRIGVAIGNTLTKNANPLPIILARQGEPNWDEVKAVIKTWRPFACIVGLPTMIDGSEQYITKASKEFAEALKNKVNLPVYLVDERLTTVEAKAQLFSEGGLKKIKQQEVDSIAACVILQQWLGSKS